MSDPVRYSLDGAVATITLDRPEAMNALTVAMKEQLLAALERARGDTAVRAVLLTGAGERAFCTGQDLREHNDLVASGSDAPLKTVREHYNPITTALATMPKPVVAAVNGMAAGAGAGFALACDFRLAADTAAFLMAFARVGLTGDSGTSWTLQRLVGHGRTTELLMLAEPVTAARALEIGLVNAVVPASDLRAAAADLAGRLAAGPTVAYAAIKESIAYASTADLPAALEKEAELQERCGFTADHAGAVAAFVAKQVPVFEGR